MKIYKTSSYVEAQKLVTYQQIFDEALQNNNGDERKAAEVVLDIATSGMWAMKDQEEIKRSIQTILKQFSKNQINENI